MEIQRASVFKDLRFWKTVLSVLMLTITTGFLGAPFFRILQRYFGWSGYGILGALLGAFFWGKFSLSVYVGIVLWFSVGLYTLWEKLPGYSWHKGFVGVVGGFLFLKFSLQWMSWTGKFEHFFADLNLLLIELLKELNTLWPDRVWTKELLLELTLSFGFIFLMYSLWMSLALERRIAKVLGFGFKGTAYFKVTSFRIPNFFIWIAMLSGLASMLLKEEHGHFKSLATSVLEFSVALYFLQGVAILEALLSLLKTGFIGRFFLYFLMIGQFALFVSGLGFIDFWMDLRKRFYLWKLHSSR